MPLIPQAAARAPTASKRATALSMSAAEPITSPGGSAKIYERKHYRGKQVSHKSLGLDMGNSGLRLVHYHNHDGTPSHRIVTHPPSPEEVDMGSVEVSDELSVNMYPYPDNKADESFRIYYGNARHPYRKPVSAKLGFYVLVGKTDDMTGGFHQMEELQQWADSHPGFHAIIRRGIHEILVMAFTHARNAISINDNSASNHRVDTVSATIPAQWDLDFEDEFGDRICEAFKEVFCYKLRRVVFHTEAQIGFHYLFHGGDMQGRPDLGLVDTMLNTLKTQTNIILNVDFGDHTMNTAMMSVIRDADGKPSLLEIQPERGTSAGTGAWAHEINELLSGRCKATSGQEMPSWMQVELLVDFHLRKHKFNHGKATTLYTEDHGSGEVAFTISAVETERTFNQAYKTSRKLLKEQLVQLSAYSTQCDIVRVLIGGGSSKHQMVRKLVKDLCEEYSIDILYMSDVAGSRHQTARLALGASYATITALSVEEFAKTAAFGITAKMKLAGDGPPVYEWINQAWPMWWNNGGTCEDISFELTGDKNEEFIIVCQPDSPILYPQNAMINTNHLCYDLLHMKGLPAGKVYLRFQLDIYEETMTIIFLKRVGGVLQYRVVGKFSTPVTVWPGSRVLNIFEAENGDNEEAPGFRPRLEATIASLASHFANCPRQTAPRQTRRSRQADTDEFILKNYPSDQDDDLPVRSQPRRKVAPKMLAEAHSDVDEDLDVVDTDEEPGPPLASASTNPRGRSARFAGRMGKGA